MDITALNPDVFKFLAALAGGALRTTVPFLTAVSRGDTSQFDRKYLVPALASFCLMVLSTVFIMPAIPQTITGFVAIASFAYAAQDLIREAQKNAGSSGLSLGICRAFKGFSCTMRPQALRSVSARLAGSGGAIAVEYRAARPLGREGSKIEAYIIDQKTGRRLDTQRIPLIGPAASHSINALPRNEGYFVIDNSESLVGPGSMITAVIGGIKKENILITTSH